MIYKHWLYFSTQYFRQIFYQDLPGGLGWPGENDLGLPKDALALLESAIEQVGKFFKDNKQLGFVDENLRYWLHTCWHSVLDVVTKSNRRDAPTASLVVDVLLWYVIDYGHFEHYKGGGRCVQKEICFFL